MDAEMTTRKGTEPRFRAGRIVYLGSQSISMIEAIFLESARKRFVEYKTLGEKTLAQLRAEDWHWRPNQSSNSIALIVQHLRGNMLSRWTNFLTEDGEKDWRQRDLEFEEGSLGPLDLKSQWDEGWAALLDTLASLQAEDLSRIITIRSQPLTVIDAINRQLAHYSYHVGQIVFLGKWLAGDSWQPLSIARGASAAYNHKLKTHRTAE
jgi:hypothetical protein